jgi:hypothetical protein
MSMEKIADAARRRSRRHGDIIIGSEQHKALLSRHGRRLLRPRAMPAAASLALRLLRRRQTIAVSYQLSAGWRLIADS